MQTDTWPKLVVESFDNENSAEYRERSQRIAEIMTGFRMGRYSKDRAEFMERELIALQEQGLMRLAS